MANNRKFTYDQLAEVTGNGIDIALFPQIREAIADRMKEIFGNDIDLSTASADGQYINMESLIFNNMYKLLSYLFDNINPNTASGKYLDVMMSLINIKRKGPTYSTAQVAVKYVGNTTLSNCAQIVAQDRNGVTWTWRNPEDVSNPGQYQYTFNSGDDPVYLVFTCDNLGPVEAYRGTAVGSPSDPDFWTQANFQDCNGSIYNELTARFKLYQTNDAILGTYNESDQSLRARKARYLGGNSTTTQEGLETAIYNYAGVDDVWIFNNNTGTSQTMLDGAIILTHDVYVVVRYKENVNVVNANKELATIIYEKLTPGVTTSDGSGGLNPGPTILGGSIQNAQIELVSGYTTNIYWKKASSTNPDIIITFTKLNGYIAGSGGDAETDCEKAIVSNLYNYLNNLPMGHLTTAAEIQVAAMGGDLKPNGTITFIPTAVTIDGTDSYQLPLNYFIYSSEEFDYTADPVVTLKIY